MSTDWTLPPLKVHVEGDDCPDERGFLRLRRLTLRNEYGAGDQSRSYRYDAVERDALDAVAILLVAPAQAPDEEPRICLRSATRPPLLLRRSARLPLPFDAALALWEVPAGLVEAGEEGVEGLRACAARETLEETGLDVEASRFELLGPPAFLSPGLMAEQVHFLWAEVDPSAAGTPTEDGSPVEEHARSIFVTPAEAFEAIGRGDVRDAKTEIALSRYVALRRAGT